MKKNRRKKEWIRQIEVANILGITSSALTYNLTKFKGDKKNYPDEYILMNHNEKDRVNYSTKLWERNKLIEWINEVKFYERKK